MSVGFEVLDASGNMLLDDKSFTVTGRVETALRGVSTIPVSDGFVAAGVEGASLESETTGGIGWVLSGNTLHVNNKGSQKSIFIFEDKIQTETSGKYGISVLNNIGETTFSSEDFHFKIISDDPVYGYEAFPYKGSDIYILHSTYPYVFLSDMDDISRQWEWTNATAGLGARDGMVRLWDLSWSKFWAEEQLGYDSFPQGVPHARLMVVRGSK